MYVARILYPVEVLGPGKRVGIWLCGCPRRCRGCSNPELWEQLPRYKTTAGDVFEMVRSIAAENPIDGFTISGGDPMMQAEELSELISLLRNISEDILVYTGYELSELDPRYLRGIAVLIDGEYIEERNSNCFLRGSDNQKIHVLDARYADIYDNYCKNGKNRIQNFFMRDGIVSVGIHRPGFFAPIDKN